MRTAAPGLCRNRPSHVLTPARKPCAQVPLSVEVSEELLAQGSAAVSEAVSVAAKEAHTNSMEYAKQRMSELYTEIGLPVPPQAEAGGA